MFRQASIMDMYYIALGSVGAIVTGFHLIIQLILYPPLKIIIYYHQGMSLPIFNILIGSMLNELNNNPNNFTDAISSLCIAFVVVGCINLLSGFLQVRIILYNITVSFLTLEYLIPDNY